LGGLFGVFVLLFCAAVARLADVQVLQPGRYVHLGEEQRVVRESLPAGRGTIFDRNGVELAMSVPQQTVFADPSMIHDPVATAQKLAPVLGLDPGALAQELHRSGRFVYLARTVPDSVARKVTNLHLQGIALMPEYDRIRPAGDLGSGVLGVTTVDGQGIAGLERQYDSLLRGTPGSAEYEHSKAGTIAGAPRKVDPARPGDDLVLTLDRGLQYQTEQLLADQVKTTGSHGGIAIVSDPSTGNILAIANVQRDSTTNKVTASSNNAALTTVFEPGSVNKVITVSAALEEHKVTPSTWFHVPSELYLGGARFTNAEAEPSDQTVSDILTISSNLGTIGIARELGGNVVNDYLHKFGFGTKTALDFPNEAAGIMLPLDQWSGSSIGSIPIGQGIAVTALQMLEAYNVIANNGVYVAPRLVDATIDQRGVEHRRPASASHRVVSATTARQVRGMLVNVVRHGTGTNAAIPGYTVAGKTGTARKPVADHVPGDGYKDASGYHYVSTFVGMAPAENPRLSIIVVMDEPTKGFYAAEVAAPLFSRLGALALRTLRIPPAAPGDNPFADIPALSSDAAASSKSERAVGPGAANTPAPQSSTTAPTSSTRSSSSSTSAPASNTAAPRTATTRSSYGG
jgi:cell division protein FtsI/penicillin-binding protein 2